jgi:LCP family protein required for cell wall assembly
MSDLSPPPRRRRSWTQRLLLVTGALLSVAALVTAGVVAWGAWKYHQIDRTEVTLDELVAGGAANYLLVGSDSRQGGDPLDPSASDDHAPLADTIMVVRVDPRSTAAKVLSFPRDLWVTQAGTGKQGRLNAAYAAGPQQLVDTLRDELGIPINHYVEVDFKGFEQVVNAIDGVPLWFDRAMRDRNTGLAVEQPGCITLDGRNALAFARSRHLQYYDKGAFRSDGTGDLGRISRQQLFLRRVIDRAKAAGVSNPLTLKRLVDVGTSSVTLDDELSVGELVAMGRQFSSFDSAALQSFTLPNTPRTTSGGAAVVDVDRAAAEPILALFRATGPEAPTDVVPETTTTVPVVHLVDPGDVTVTVLNSTGEQGVAFTAYQELEGEGFSVEHYGNGDEFGRPALDRSTVRYAPGRDYEALTVAAWVQGGADAVEDASLPPGAVVLFLGEDFSAFATPTSTTTSTTTTTSVPPIGSADVPVVAAPTEVVGVVPGSPPPGKTCG